MEEQRDLNGQAALADEEQKMKWWQVFWGMIRRPGQTYRETRGRAGLLIPVLLIIGGTIFVTVTVGLTQQEQIAAELQREMAGVPDMTSEQLENLPVVATSPAALAVGAVGAVVGALLTWVIYSGILHLAVRALGGRGVFRQAFEIAGWAWVPLFIGSLTRGTYALFTGKLPVAQGTGLVHAFVTNTNLFNVWNMVLLVVGFSAVYGVTKKRAAVPVVGMWLLTVLLTYATGFLGQGFAPGTPGGR